MYRKEVNAHSPLRILEQSIHGGLGQGNLGVIMSHHGVAPKIARGVFIADTAVVIGDVEIGEGASIWFGCVVRGDGNAIRIGERTNIQDACVLHVRGETGPLSIGSDVTLGHGAIAHACTIGDNCLIGMGAIVLDNAEINPYTLVAAGAVVRTNARFPGGVLVAGVPAKIVRDLTPEERTMIDQSARSYVGYARTYKGQ